MQRPFEVNFVSHQGKEKITVRCVAPSRYDVDYKWMADEMTKQMKEKVNCFWCSVYPSVLLTDHTKDR